jgi:hypothetical protein
MQMNWIPGRQGGGYLKLPLFRFWRFDCYLIKYPTGASVQFHTDHAHGCRHYRLNIMLRRPKRGGAFHMRGKPLLEFWRVRLFRPDLCAHSVETVLEGVRLVLSFGWARPSRRP